VVVELFCSEYESEKENTIFIRHEFFPSSLYMVISLCFFYVTIYDVMLFEV